MTQPIASAAAPVRWTAPTPAAAMLSGAASAAPLGLGRAMARGWAGRCPACGQGRLFTGWLTVNPMCSHCAAPLGRLRADDAPPYIVIFLTGHLVIGAELALDRSVDISLWAEAAIFLPLTLALCMGLLRPVKGALIGLMLKLDMFSPALEPAAGTAAPGTAVPALGPTHA